MQINHNWTFLRLNLISRSLEPEKEICILNLPAWQKEYLENEDTKKHLVALASIDLAAIFPTILLNALVIFAVATRRRLRKQLIYTSGMFSWGRFANRAYHPTYCLHARTEETS